MFFWLARRQRPYKKKGITVLDLKWNAAIKTVAGVLLLASTAARGEGWLVGLEYEQEKDNHSGITSRSVSVAPGWEFPEENLLSRIELLFEASRDASVDNEGVRGRENIVFLRLRHDGDLTSRIGYYVRGGVGRNSNNERNFNFAYIEPALEFKLTDSLEWTFAYREINSIDNAPGERVHKLLFGPNFDLDKHNEFELRYAMSKGDEDTKAWLIEYVHRF